MVSTGHLVRSSFKVVVKREILSRFFFIAGVMLHVVGMGMLKVHEGG